MHQGRVNLFSASLCPREYTLGADTRPENLVYLVDRHQLLKTSTVYVVQKPFLSDYYLELIFIWQPG